jgi:pyridoxine kinase
MRKEAATRTMATASSSSDHATSCLPPKQERILSIQSHVVSGYVGNKAAVFPLQLLGFDVDVVNSVHFSNHTGYPGGVEGDVLQGNQLRSLLDGLKRNGLLQNVQHLLTGYIGSSSFLEAVLEVLHTLRQFNPTLRFVCDPVMGDSGKFYVPVELVQVYREKVIPFANVVTPNQFEVEQLTGINITTLDDALQACQALHDMGPELVLITSIIFQTNQPNDDGIVEPEKSMTIIASQRPLIPSGTEQVWRIDCSIIPGGPFTGTGDLCAALLLGHTAQNPDDLRLSLERTMSTMYTVIQRTQQAAAAAANSSTTNHHNNVNDSHIIQARELQLIQSRRDIEDPPALFQAQRLK